MMEPEDRRMLTEIHASVNKMEPVLAANTQALLGLDARQRASEIKSAEHGIQIKRLEGDVSGIFRSLRSLGGKAVEASKSFGDGKWVAVLEFLAIFPKYWHIIFSIGTVIITLLITIFHKHLGIHL